jgi:hypothetical protein
MNTVFQYLNPSGTLRQQLAGIAVAGAGGAFTIPTRYLPRPPRAGDRLQTADRKWWRVASSARGGDDYAVTGAAEGGGQ